MKKRSRIPRKKSRKMFTKSATGAHPKNNMSSRPMRGGIRL